ncbi:MAG: DUF3313 domain-containing protein [Betaproteobacteria bacterium]
MMTSSRNCLIRRACACAVATAIVLGGCSTGGTSTTGGGAPGVVASDASAIARTGFLSDYARLRPAPNGEGMLCWRDDNVDWKRYDKVMIERIQVYIAPGAKPNPVDPTDLKMLLDYFHGALVKAITPEAQVVNAIGPGVLRVRIALTDLRPTNAAESLLGTAVPYGFVAEIGSGAATGRPAGSTPYMGDTGLAVQFRDGVSGKIVAECADNEIGRKYAADLNNGVSGAATAWADGYMESFTSWSYAKDAFDKWSNLFAKRFAALRGIAASK